jgi:CheY-like chemotaxis protein
VTRFCQDWAADEAVSCCTIVQRDVLEIVFFGKDNNAGVEDTHEAAALPEAFVEQVKEALENLYDFPSLQRHPLAQALTGEPRSVVENGGSRLRRELIAAIETLNPGAGISFRAPNARVYNMLHLRYVQGMTIQEAAHELGVSPRQAYRDLRRGEEGVATVLWVRLSGAGVDEPNARRLSSVQAEMDRLETHPRAIDLCELLEHARSAVEQLAQRQGVTSDLRVPGEPAIVSADPALARQILVSILSQAVQQAAQGAMELALYSGKDQVSLVLAYTPASAAASTSVVTPPVAQLVERLKWRAEQTDRPGGLRTVVLHIPVCGPIVLVIDDNEGLVELLDRYLTGHACRVLAAGSGQEGLQLAQESAPDAILLDIMMPGMDGWDVLQRLRTRPETATVPVIICSVFNDPELAYSLGAAHCLPKPVRRDDVLRALRALGVV